MLFSFLPIMKVDLFVSKSELLNWFSRFCFLSSLVLLGPVAVVVVFSAAAVVAVVAVVCVAVYYDIGVAHAIAVAANVEVCKSAVVDELVLS